MENNDAEQLQIRLTTKQPHYAVPDVPYSIEGNVTTAELNTFVHALLAQSATDVKSPDFDFLVLGEYLQGRLCDYLREKSVSSEDTIEIEYVERFPAPEPLDCLLHDDWVAAVKTCGKWILTGCYDNTVNLWTIKGEHKLTIPGHTMPVKAVAWVSLDDERGKFISCSQDQYAMLWEWQIKTNSVECVSVCKGHERGLHCVDVSPDGKRFTTGGWDTMLKIWLTEDEDDHSQSKRARTDMSTTKIPKMTLQGHRECISSVQWMSNETILTGSWDHTMKVWDLNLEGIKTEISANKSIFDANYSPLNRLIVTASADKNIRVYDSRMTQGAVVCNTFYGHKEWVQCVMWSKEEEHLFISGSYDNQSKLWDCRSPKAPLYDLIGHNDKVMDIDWSNPKYIVSGGSDNTVRVYKARKAMQTDKMDTK